MVGETQAARVALADALELVREMGNDRHLATLVEAVAFTLIADGSLVEAARLLASAGAATATIAESRREARDAAPSARQARSSGK